MAHNLLRAQRTRRKRDPFFAKELWAIRWDTSAECADGETSRLVCDPFFHPARLAIFDSRQKAREWIDAKYGYLKVRPDLRAYPHGWKYPVPVKVQLTAVEVGAQR